MRPCSLGASADIIGDGSLTEVDVAAGARLQIQQQTIIALSHRNKVLYLQPKNFTFWITAR